MNQEGRKEGRKKEGRKKKGEVVITEGREVDMKVGLESGGVEPIK